MIFTCIFVVIFDIIKALKKTSEVLVTPRLRDNKINRGRFFYCHFYFNTPSLPNSRTKPMIYILEFISVLLCALCACGFLIVFS